MLTQHTAPTVFPFQTAEDWTIFKMQFLKFETVDEELVRSFVQAAVFKTQTETRRSLYNQKWLLTLDSFPPSREIILEYPPIVEVESVKYDDSNGNEQTLSSDFYSVDTKGSPGRLVLKSQEQWPSTIDNIGAVRIIYEAGYGETDAEIPPALLQAIKMLTAHFYNLREPVTNTTIVQVPMSYEWLVAPYRVYAA